MPDLLTPSLPKAFQHFSCDLGSVCSLATAWMPYLLHPHSIGHYRQMHVYTPLQWPKQRTIWLHSSLHSEPTTHITHYCLSNAKEDIQWNWALWESMNPTIEQQSRTLLLNADHSKLHYDSETQAMIHQWSNETCNSQTGECIQANGPYNYSEPKYSRLQTPDIRAHLSHHPDHRISTCLVLSPLASW